MFHEIGRVAELQGFPYSQVGVDNDGAVVSPPPIPLPTLARTRVDGQIARSERGQIGVAMCSFLEPLRS